MQGFLTARMSFSHYLAPCVVDLNGDDEEDDNDDYDVSLMCKLQCLTVQPSKYHCAFKDNMNSNNNTSLTSESVNGNTTYDGDANGSMIEKGIFECNEESEFFKCFIFCILLFLLNYYCVVFTFSLYFNNIFKNFIRLFIIRIIIIYIPFRQAFFSHDNGVGNKKRKTIIINIIFVVFIVIFLPHV